MAILILFVVLVSLNVEEKEYRNISRWIRVWMLCGMDYITNHGY
ncbi:MAG TPA: hypothetical protein PLY58_01595 [Bacilli bacterium]|nr:hypothetical protein [Bacilli bacterium]HPY79800.1 hypothetical protein [Bacilli bacterium]HQA55764.1 hypothetical protein [Bacilli bacterium]